MSESTTVTKVGQFVGALSQFARNVYGDLVCFGLPKRVAHAVALDYASDLGKAMQTDGKLASKVAKAKEDGESGFKLSGKTGEYRLTPAMSLGRVAQQLDGLKKEKLIDNGDVMTCFAYTGNVMDYLKPLLEEEAAIVAKEAADKAEAEAKAKAAKAAKAKADETDETDKDETSEEVNA